MRRTLLAALAMVVVVAALAGCGLRGGRDSAPDPEPTTAPSSSDVSIDAVLDDLAEVDASLDDVSGSLSEGEAAEGQE